MKLILETPPASLAEAMLQSVCDHLRRHAALGDSPEIAPPDLDYIRECTAAAVAYVDGPRSTIRRCLLRQDWRLTLDRFPAVIEIPLAPLESIVSFKYLDGDGVQQTLTADRYRISGAQSWRPEISPAYGESWPDTRFGSDVIEIVFEAGFGTIGDIPADILMAIRQIAAHFYTERQPVTFTTPHEMPLTVASLLAPWKVFR